MTDASTAHGKEPTEPIKPEPLFPSEGDFSTVVPLSQVGRAHYTAERSADDGRPAEARWAREDRRGTAVAKAAEEEETLVPARSGRRRVAGVGSTAGAGRRSWPVTAAAVLLSVLAGVAAGSYLVWSKRPVVSDAPPAADTAATEVATDIPPPAPAAPTAAEAEPVAPAAPARAAVATETKPERSAETPSRAEKVTPAAAEPATRANAQPRPRVERPAPDATATTPAPRPARNDAPARRAATNAARPPTRPTTSARQLPVSAPPPSSRPKTVIQWP
ncbi:MAG: hypothetical protein ABW250_13535 [Pyrinomonadaceae bacterium]